MNAEVLEFTSLSDDQLLTETKRLAAYERRATAALLRSLNEGRLASSGFSCAKAVVAVTDWTQLIHLSEGAAYNRIEAAPRGTPLSVSAHGTRKMAR